MVAYHDDEWGRPCHDDTELFERLALESFQAGLSWSTILRKREAFRAAFRGFDPRVVAAFDAGDRERLMADAGIVRNGAKIDATIGQRGGVPGDRGGVRVVRRVSRGAGAATAGAAAVRRRSPATIPASTPASDALSADLKRRGFRFVGSTIVYAFMQSVGLVDDHLPELLPLPRLRPVVRGRGGRTTTSRRRARAPSRRPTRSTNGSGGGVAA